MQDQRIFMVERYFAEKLKNKRLELYASKFVDAPKLNRKNILRSIARYMAKARFVQFSKCKNAVRPEPRLYA